MKKFTLFLMLMIFSYFGYSQATDLFFSEYIEGSSNNKALEIYNGTGSTVTLDGVYRVQTFANGSATANYTLDLTGDILNGDVYVIANSSAATAILDVADVTSTVTYYNGDDHVALLKYVVDTWVPIDNIGELGVDPGSAWDVAGVSGATREHTLVRKADVCSPNTDWAASAGTDATNSEWIVYDQDEFSYIGSHTSNCSGGNIPPVVINIIQTPSEDILAATTVSISADVTDTDGTVDLVELHWGTTSGSLGNTINMSLDAGSIYITNTDIPAQAVGTTVFYQVYAEDNIGDGSTSSEYSYTIIEPQMTSLPYVEPFDADLGQCYTKSVLGDTKAWIWASYGSNGYAYMSGYDSGETEEDWLILPAIDFDVYSNERMTFETWFNYGTFDANNYLKLYYSDDYYGVGDPTTASWTEITFTVGNATEWTSSGELDLSGITGSNVYLGFKYYDEPGDGYRNWEVDNISIYEATPEDVIFQVNMEEQTVDPNTGVHVAGSFNGWSASATELVDDGTGGDQTAGDNIYSVTIPLFPGLEYQYKYINGDAWGSSGTAQEIVPSACGVDDGSGGYNRAVTPTGAMTLDVVCYGSCFDCGYVTPTYDVTFQVDMQNETVGGVVNIAGNFNSWGDTPMTNVGGNIWAITLTFDEGSFLEYKFKNGGDWEPGGNRTFIVPSENTVLDLVCYGSTTHCDAVDFVMINEVDADTPSTDDQEFIELYDGGAGYTPLHGLLVVLYNGNGDISYGAFDLDGYFTDANGYFLLGNSGVTPTPNLIFPSNTLQNGPDALALYIGNDTDFPDGTAVTATNTVDALVYDTDDSDDSGLLDVLTPGQPQINENGRGDKDNHSNQRIPNGSGGLLVTSTYDQSPPTPGEENIGIYTDWTGAENDVWNNDNNWTNMRPDAGMNAMIPNTASTFPMIYVEGAESNDLTIESGASLDIYGSLTVNGTFTNNGTLNILSDEFGTGSLIEHDGVYANVERYFTGDPTATQDWHLVSSPVSDAQAGVFTGMYLQSFNHANYEYLWITDELTPLNVAEGYGLYSLLSVDNTVTFSGVLNYDIPPVNIYTGADSYNWNLLGNPYPSSIDWEAVTIPAGMTNEVHYIIAATSGDASYVQGVGGVNGGSQYISPMQGFFVSATGNDVLQLGDAVRTHSGKDNFYKNENSNMLLLEASGENFTDETMIHFNENAGVEHDGQFDAYKRISESNPELPQIFSYTPQGVKLGINGMPQTNMVPVGFTAGESGEFTISAKETGDFSTVILEDVLLGTQTDLLSNSYTFNFVPGDIENRFILHFTPLKVDDNAANLYTIFAANNEIRVLVPANTSGNIMVYNLMGQEIISSQINGTRNTINMNESGTYLVKVIGSDGVSTKKVFIK